MMVIFNCFMLISFLSICGATKVATGNHAHFEGIVHWMEEPSKIEVPAARKAVDIYCYPGTTKSILALWQTPKFNIKIHSNNDDFNQYIGGSPEEVFDLYSNNYGWTVNPFQKKASKIMSLDVFNTTCMAVVTKEKHSIELHISRIDIWRVLLMSTGITAILLSRVLSGNPIFYYLCGILIGVFASFMVVLYYIGKLLPKKTLTYSIIIGGWTVGVYIFQQIFENIQVLLQSYQTHFMWYTVIVSFISFLVCYRIGPPKNRRSQNLVMWTLQLVGTVMIFFSSEYREAGAAIIVLALGIKYFPRSLLYYLATYWRRKFPPKPRLLSSEEYYEEGARETKEALDSLRKYCSSPDCAQWRIMLKLNDSSRFASFVEGNSHLSDDEVLNYESYAYSLGQCRKSPTANNTLEFSDDDDESDSEEEY